MKKIINIILVIVALLTILVTHNIVRAQQTIETVQKEATKSVDYILPYPGILPDNPLYPLKMIRDRVISWFIFDPVKKAEYFLLMADKRINAGKMLIDYGKHELGESTISKGQAYTVKAMEQAQKAKAYGRDITALMEKLDKATSKHLEVLQGVLEKVPEQAKKGIQNAILNSQKGHNNILRIMERNRLRKQERQGEEVTPTEEQKKLEKKRTREETEAGEMMGETKQERERQETEKQTGQLFASPTKGRGKGKK